MVRAWKIGPALLAGGLTVAAVGCAEPVTSVEFGEKTGATVRGSTLYVDGNSAAAKQVAAWRSARPADAALLEKVSAHASGAWFGDWNADVGSDVSRVMADAGSQQALPVLVAYNIPQRDCGLHSGGGASGANAYRTWIRQFAQGLAKRPAIVILEPDALALTDCLSEAQRHERFSMLRFAVETLSAQNAFVYIDAGVVDWLSPAEAAQRLVKAGIGLAEGFALNVSNFVGNSANIEYGNAIARQTGGKHFVIDSSRNGAGSNGEWCNPSGRALGTRPNTTTAHEHVDAFLWIKKPGESDGSCNGGPAAGEFWSEYALGLAQRWSPAMAVADVAP